MKRFIATALLALLLPVFANADLRVIEILPHTLNYEDSSSNRDNQSDHRENRVSDRSNSANNPENRWNGRDESRRLLNESNRTVGYYAVRSDGHINYFYPDGARYGYTPAGGHTRGLFFDKFDRDTYNEDEGNHGSWCGVLLDRAGEIVLGLRWDCYDILHRIPIPKTVEGIMNRRGLENLPPDQRRAWENFKRIDEELSGSR